MKIKNKTIWIGTILLIIVEQAIKLVINFNYLHSNFPIVKPWLYFSPMFNRDYSWLNSMFQLGVGKWIHILIVIFMLTAIIIFYKFLCNEVEITFFIDITFSFLISAAMCSLIDKVFWNGSLDYIYVNGYFTFDLKDVYINVFIALIIIMLISNYKGLRKVDDSKVFKSFWEFIKNGKVK